MKAVADTIGKIFKTFLWGNSIALAWTWGIGLFFTVQLAIQFGLKALFIYASINAFGLTLFGLLSSLIARQYPIAEAFEAAFLSKAKNFKFAFLLYQFLALTLTVFCCLKYVTLPLGVLSVLVGATFIGAVIFLGEEFPIAKIKYSHFLMGIGIFCALRFLITGLPTEHNLINDLSASLPLINLNPYTGGIYYSAFWIPIIIGFLFGPWLDLQHWQRAIQIRKENLSVSASYIIGGLIFWCLLIANGLIALVAFRMSTNIPEISFAHSPSIDSSSLLYQVKNTITVTFKSLPEFHHLLNAYVVFICLATLSTLDSGYIAFKWYLSSLVKDSKNIVFSFIPVQLVSSPIPWLILTAVVATTTMHFSEVGKFVVRFDPSLEKFFRFELEYYLAFYASFFIMYAVTFIRSMLSKNPDRHFSMLKLLSTSLCSLSIFGIGYFGGNTIVMAIASLIPLVYGLFTHSKNSQPIIQAMPNTVINNENNLVSVNSNSQITPNYIIPAGAEPLPIQGCYKQGNWFVHSFIPTYQDTNSVGNIYFAMYAMWVGKTRELFFLHTTPGFDPKTSDFLILTRSFEHKFLREAREFDPVTIQVRICAYNRKFVTLEHQIFNHKNEMLGKGKQSLMFVSSKDYSLIDIPKNLYAGYIPFYTGKAEDVHIPA
jgi:acyl-CoA thioesterase FadM